MKGRRSFSEQEAKNIRRLLAEVRRADRSGQKLLRNTLRRGFGFYISDFGTGGSGFDATDFDRLVAKGVIRIQGVTAGLNEPVPADLGLGDEQSWEALRAGFRPDRVQILFVGESAPPNGKSFFYAANSRLFRFWKAAFEDVFRQRWDNDDAFLYWFQEKGCYLEDLLQGPVPASRQRRHQLWETAVSGLARRIQRERPSAVITVMKAIRPFVEAAVAEAGGSPWQITVGFPFPGAHFRKAEQEARDALEKVKQRNLIVSDLGD